MDMEKNNQFGKVISRIIAGEHLSKDEAYQAFCAVLANEVTDMQQGAFLAALTTKGETAEEVAGGWKAVYELDTNKVDLGEMLLVDNCGTGMDSFKTFNISTAASLVAAAGGVKIARHGARAITSSCGTVDMVEMLGVDVECSCELVAQSIKQAGIGLFNGMSPEVHPMALGRILSQISFGSPLNIAASLANPALPRVAVRGVYSQELLQPVARVMHEIGYSDAFVIYGGIASTDLGMDEASVCGRTLGVHLQGEDLREVAFVPEDYGLKTHKPETIAADVTRDTAAKKMYQLLAGQGDEPRNDAVILNSGLIFYVSGMTPNLLEGVEKAREILLSGDALGALKRWIEIQNSDASGGFEKLAKLAG